MDVWCSGCVVFWLYALCGDSDWCTLCVLGVLMVMGCTLCRQRQDLSGTYLAHHELESDFITIVIISIGIITV